MPGLNLSLAIRVAVMDTDIGIENATILRLLQEEENALGLRLILREDATHRSAQVFLFALNCHIVREVGINEG